MNTVLVVDDDPDIRDQVCEKLNDSGYKTLEASTGEEAVSLFAEQRPDLVVLDVKLEEGFFPPLRDSDGWGRDGSGSPRREASRSMRSVACP